MCQTFTISVLPVFTDQAGAVLLLLWLFWMSTVWLDVQSEELPTRVAFLTSPSRMTSSLLNASNRIVSYVISYAFGFLLLPFHFPLMSFYMVYLFTVP